MKDAKTNIFDMAKFFNKVAKKNGKPIKGGNHDGKDSKRNDRRN